VINRCKPPTPTTEREFTGYKNRSLPTPQRRTLRLSSVGGGSFGSHFLDPGTGG
jgi:hypothetical protein